MKRAAAKPPSAPAVKARAPKIDIRGVAAHAGVSIATVSRTINRIPTVDPELAKRVWKSVEELDYMPNTQARALVSGKSRLLGLIVSEITNPFFPELIQEFEKLAVERGYEILIASTNYEPRTMEMCARRMLERKVDGVAIMTFGVEDFLIDRLIADDLPITFIQDTVPHQAGALLTVDYRAGIREGVQHLAALGHTQIGFISGPLRLASARARRTVFIECLRSAKLGSYPDWVVEGDHTLDGGRDAMVQLLKSKKWPTAIMCSNDMTAIGVQHAIFEAGLRVPDDISLIGYDDIHLAEYTIPPLTTIRMSCKDLARHAIDAILTPREPGAKKATVHKITTRLIVRQTTGAPRAAGAKAKKLSSKYGARAAPRRA